MNSNSHEHRQRRPKVLCLGVSFPCIEQSAKQAGISLPQSAVIAAASLLADEQQQASSPTSIIRHFTTPSQQNANHVDVDQQQQQQQNDDDSNDERLLPLDNDNNADDNDRINQITAMVQECVQTNILTQMDGRDLIRCLATEHSCHVDVYTVSQECGAVYNSRRHLHANFNRSNFVSKLQRHFGIGIGNNTSTSTLTSTSSPILFFDQVILDYFWIPLGWDAEHWTRMFFSQVLVDLCNVLQPNTGVIYLPFCCHCFKQVLVCRDILTRHYNISFVRRRNRKQQQGTTTTTSKSSTCGDDGGDGEGQGHDDEDTMEQIFLWKGTQQINAKIMQGVFGKRLDQEEIYCTFGPRNVNEDMEDVAISKVNVLDTCKRLEDFHDIRFIALRRIQQQQLDDDIVDDSPVVVLSLVPSVSAAAALPIVQQPQSPHGPLVSRRILPLRTCRQSEPKTATTVFNKRPPPSAAAKRTLFSNKNKVGRPKKKHKNNRGSIVGLQDPRTIQRGFFSTSIATTAIIRDNSSAATSRTSTITTTTRRVVTPTPAATAVSKIFKEHDDDDDKTTRKRRSSPLSSIQDDDDDEEEMDKKPKALFFI